MHRGYVKLWRKSLDAGWIRNHKLWAFWTWCLMNASHKEFDTVVGLQTVHLMPGQFIFGRKRAAEETGLTEREIRGRLDLLKTAGNLTIKTTNKFSIIAVENWHTYQGDGSEKGQQVVKQRTTNKNDKNKKYHICREDAFSVLVYLNEKTGKRFRDASAIESRLKDGGTVEDCKRIIDAKLKDPHFINNPRFLCPNTLFRKSHWDAYLNEAQPPAQRPDSAPGVRPVACPTCGRTVLSTDMAGPVCILCHGEVRAHA